MHTEVTKPDEDKPGEFTTHSVVVCQKYPGDIGLDLIQGTHFPKKPKLWTCTDFHQVGSG